MPPLDHEVKISNGREERVITMRHPPPTGKYLTVEDEPWEVISVSYTVPYRIPSMSFIVKEEQAS